MRILVLVLLLLINSFSLPLQAMSSHLMPVNNIPCNMSEMQFHTDNAVTPDNQSMSMCQSMATDVNDISQIHTCCEMTNCGECTSTSLIPFITMNKLVIAIPRNTTAALYYPSFLPEQYQESLYRPPLIN